MFNDTVIEERISAAITGDQQAFSDLVEPYRGELLVHCYRLLASQQDAEDMVQETFLRAWKRMDSFTGGPYFRAWLYKIATNVCLDTLDKRPHRVLSTSIFPASDPLAVSKPPIAEPIWLEPFPDELLPEAAPSPEARYSLRESITLAFLAALQFLPPRQRAVLILCDVLDWQAKEAAQLLDITLAAMHGLLRRARSTMASSYRQKEPVTLMDNKVRSVLNQYIEAWESADVERLISLLADKVVLTMPPSPTWFSGRGDVAAHTRKMFTQRKYQKWQLRQTKANGQVAFAGYHLEDNDGLYHAHSFHMLTFENSEISEIHMFILPALFAKFGLPMIL